MGLMPGRPQSVMPGTLEGDLMARRKCYRNRSAQRRLDPVVMAASKKTSRDDRRTLSSRPLSLAVQFLLDHFVSAKQDFLRYGNAERLDCCASAGSAQTTISPIMPANTSRRFTPLPLFRRMIRGVRYALLVVLVSAVTCAAQDLPDPGRRLSDAEQHVDPEKQAPESVPVRSIPRPSQCATRRHAKAPGSI